MITQVNKDSNSSYYNDFQKNTVKNTDYQKIIQEKAVKADTDTDERMEQAFQSVGPNAPEQVKDAWMEAAKETGVDGMGMKSNGMLGHISQMMVQKAVKWYNGVTDYSDILGGTVESAIRAAEKALYDLEHPLNPHSTRSLEVQQQILKEKNFYQVFLDKLQS